MSGKAEPVSKRGADAFMEHLNPVIREASLTMGPQDLAHLYSGIFDAFYGCLCADFGFADALDGMELFAERARKCSASEGALPC